MSVIQAWENDPRPTIIFMYAIEGIHPRTGHQHRYIQAINFTYIPRSMRRQFARDWTRTFERTNGNIRFTWETVQRKYPYLRNAVRRYFYRPTYYIRDLTEIPLEDIEKTVISTWSKDFSKKVKATLISKFRRIMRARRGR